MNSLWETLEKLPKRSMFWCPIRNTFEDKFVKTKGFQCGQALTLVSSSQNLKLLYNKFYNTHGSTCPSLVSVLILIVCFIIIVQSQTCKREVEENCDCWYDAYYHISDYLENINKNYEMIVRKTTWILETIYDSIHETIANRIQTKPIGFFVALLLMMMLH